MLNTGILMSLGLESLLCFLACFFSSTTLLRRFRSSRLEVAAFARVVSLLSRRQALLGFVLAASEDEVDACTREILVFYLSLLGPKAPSLKLGSVCSSYYFLEGSTFGRYLIGSYVIIDMSFFIHIYSAN